MPVRLRIVGCWCVQMWHYFRCYEKCFCEFRSDPRSKAHTHTNNHFCANFGNSFERLDQLGNNHYTSTIPTDIAYMDYYQIYKVLLLFRVSLDH